MLLNKLNNNNNNNLEHEMGGQWRIETKNQKGNDRKEVTNL